MKSSEKQIDKIDQLFKNKLDDHTIAPSENAWAKVETSLSKKNNIVLWRLAAAVLLMGALLSVVYWSQTGNDQEKVLAKKSDTPSPKKLEKASTPNTQKRDNTANVRREKNKVEQKETANRLANKHEVDQKENTQEKKPSKSRKKMMEIEASIAQQYPRLKLDHKETTQDINKIETKNDVEKKIKTEATPKTEVASSKQKPIKLEFTLEALPTEEIVATTEEVKSTGLKKVLNLAREIKQGEGPVTSLREKKDELFANNFLAKKEKHQ
jgi:hypothetical protein